MKNKVYSFQNCTKAQNKGTKKNNPYIKRTKIKNYLEENTHTQRKLNPDSLGPNDRKKL